VRAARRCLIDHSGDDGEHVVEVMKNATDELAKNGRSLKPIALRLVALGGQGLPSLSRNIDAASSSSASCSVGSYLSWTLFG
jgi:hypothetical protein